MLDDGETRLHAEFLGDDFVHRYSGTKNTRAEIGEIGQFEKALHGTVFAEGSV